MGNGYLGHRVPPQGSGYAEPGGATGFPLYTPRYDGAFVAGLFARHPGVTAGREVIAALPTWTGLVVRAGDGESFTPETPTGRVSHYRQTVFLRCGLVRTSLTWTASDGRATDLVFEVLADRVREHVGAVRLRLRPHWSGRATVTDLLDGRGARRITGVRGERAKAPVPARERARAAWQRRAGQEPSIAVPFRTDGTRIEGAVVSTLRAGHGVVGVGGGRPGPGPTRPPVPRAVRGLSAAQSLTFRAQRGTAYEFTKYVGVDTGRTSRAPLRDATAAAQNAAARGWRRTLGEHTAAWASLWHADIDVRGRPELRSWVRSAQYGLLASGRRGSPYGVAPTGLSSDNYAGQTFWDAEVWQYPALLATRPALARSVLEYRYRTRAAARANARRLGYPGLFYPWTSGAHGDLWRECHSWDPPHCTTQNHLQGDIAWATWQYYLATGDRRWLRDRGWPLLRGIAEFWAGRATRNADGSYSIVNVAGPDEYSNGVRDGVFTNAGAALALRNAQRAAEQLGQRAPARWRWIADRLRIPFDARRQVFQQYDGYRGATIKQADAVLLRYPLEWPMADRTAAHTLAFYAPRTDPDGPAMSDSVHAVIAAGLGEPGCATYTYLERASRPFFRGPFALFAEARGDKAGASDPLAGSPAQDFITGKGGFLQVFTHGLTGLRMREDRLLLDPMLPPQLAGGVTLRGLHWRGRTYDVAIGAHTTTVRLTGGAPFAIETPQGPRRVSADAPAVLVTRRPDRTPTDNLARCRAARPSSAEPGSYAGAAVDGSTSTAWVPAAAAGTLTADLGQVRRITRITPSWTAVRPLAYTLRISRDGRHWRPWNPADPAPTTARYVRVWLRGPQPAAQPTGAGRPAAPRPAPAARGDQQRALEPAPASAPADGLAGGAERAGIAELAVLGTRDGR